MKLQHDHNAVESVAWIVMTVGTPYFSQKLAQSSRQLRFVNMFVIEINSDRTTLIVLISCTFPVIKKLFGP